MKISICKKHRSEKLKIETSSPKVNDNVFSILSQTYNATLFLFDYFYVHAHALGKLFHLIKRSFSQASNPTLVLTIHIKLSKKQ